MSHICFIGLKKSNPAVRRKLFKKTRLCLAMAAGCNEDGGLMVVTNGIYRIK